MDNDYQPFLGFWFVDAWLHSDEEGRVWFVDMWGAV